MRKSRALIGVTGLALAATSVLASTSTTAAAEPAGTTVSAGGRGAATATAVEPLSKAQLIRRAAESAVAGDPITMPTSYPYQPDLKIYRDNADDAAHTAELIGHPDIAPKLLDLMAVSDRISVQVVGQSSEGRDLYLVTLTAPETVEETAEQAAWKSQMKNDPDAAAANTALLNGYKTPIWISNNIHGNEWEGTDAAMQYIEHLATAPLSEVRGVLANNRVYFSPSLNPDGRTNATRATALGLDPNRDMITNTTPETRSFIRQAQAIQPIYAADFHGYTGVLQMEPCGPPHGSNYEYDLYMPHNYALALKVEKDVVAAAIPGNTYYDPATDDDTTENTGFIKIPYRDTPDGWDDFPPIFTAQYAAFYGAASATVELPKSRNAPGGRQSPENAVINTEVALQTMESIVGYMNVAGNAKDMIKNQIEVFRRGTAGEPKDNLTTDEVGSVPGPTQWQSLWDVVDNQEPVTLPRAYVIPTGGDQRSESDATSLVKQLLLHDIEVGTLAADTLVGATTYPKGSYVVDMHQPLRGLANSLLDLGEDISAKVPSMYDISAWSYSYTWGATVDKVGLTTDAPLGTVIPIGTVPAAGTAPSAPDYVTFDVAGVSDYRALNALLEDEVPVSMLADGSAVVGAASYPAVVEAAEEFGIDFEPATDAELAALDDEDTKPLSDLTIGYVGNQDDKLSLQQLGFDDLTQLTASGLNGNPTLLNGVDLLWVGTNFSTADVPPSQTNPTGTSFAPARAAVQSFVNRGGSLLGRTNAGFNAAVAAGLMTGTVTNGNGSGNGIVAVDTPAGSVLAPYAQDTSFIYPAYSFSALGENVKVEQTYDATDPLLAGHWRGTTATNGPDYAAGKASAVSSVNATTGAKSLVFGTSVFFRTHPKGGLSQAARALFWAAPEGTAVVAPQATSVAIAPVADVTYPGSASVRVTTSTAGTVSMLAGGKEVASGPTAAGAATLTVSGLKPGSTSLVARFTPSDSSFEPSVSAPVTVRVAKARSALRLSAKEIKVARSAKRGKAKVTITFAVPNVPTNGRIVLTDKGRTVKVVRLAAGRSITFTLKLTKGRHTLRAKYAGSSLVRASASPVRTIRIR
ncbi:M14 family metallopeptidase [Nocardioides sp. W7]|uniref:M14 family metallopeptidase n=1 Tax=Nocardioides sp. W7 TaxID=2931390 RepID=UPI001FD0610F|nr:M14 family metallopeptidase [Nocardioides sp. W7]